MKMNSLIQYEIIYIIIKLQNHFFPQFSHLSYFLLLEGLVLLYIFTSNCTYYYLFLSSFFIFFDLCLIFNSKTFCSFSGDSLFSTSSYSYFPCFSYCCASFLFQQFSHLHRSLQILPPLQHSQYFFLHPDFLQLQPDFFISFATSFIGFECSQSTISEQTAGPNFYANTG